MFQVCLTAPVCRAWCSRWCPIHRWCSHYCSLRTCSPLYSRWRRTPK